VSNSPGCLAGEYTELTIVTLNASPNAGSVVTGWSGTDDDTSTAVSNTVTMPAAAHSASVSYGVPLTCYALTLAHTGNGADPVPTPANSPGCAAGEYEAGTTISVTAAPDLDSEVANWSGTTNDSSTAEVNTVSMPASAHTVTVNYVIVEVKDPPINPTATFEWQGDPQNRCRKIDFYWQDPGWTSTPVGFRVFQDGAYIKQVTGMTFDANATVDHGNTIVFGVQAVFVQGLEYSKTLEATFLCSNGNLILTGELTK
jgi:hypothetical protein